MAHPSKISAAAPGAEGGKTAAEGKHKFAILKNYPESRHYEVAKKKQGFLDSMLEKIGLRRGLG